MKTYQLSLTKEQICVVMKAMEVFARLGIGQFHDAMESLPIDSERSNKWHEALLSIGEILERHTTCSVNGWTSSLSIGSDKTHRNAKIAWEVYQVIRHRLAWEQAVERKFTPSLDGPRDWQTMMGCQYDSPSHISDTPLAILQSSELQD